jgi:hypothetical protein
VYLNGAPIRCGDAPLNVAPVPVVNVGRSDLVIGSYWQNAAQSKMGAGGSTSARIARFLVLRCQQRDPQLPWAIAEYWARGNYDLPPYMRAL